MTDPIAYTAAVTEARKCLEASEDANWRLAELTFEQVEGGTSRRQWARDVGVSHTHVNRLYQVWKFYGGNQVSTRPPWHYAYEEVRGNWKQGSWAAPEAERGYSQLRDVPLTPGLTDTFPPAPEPEPVPEPRQPVVPYPAKVYWARQHAERPALTPEEAALRQQEKERLRRLEYVGATRIMLQGLEDAKRARGRIAPELLTADAELAEQLDRHAAWIARFADRLREAGEYTDNQVINNLSPDRE